MKRSSVRYGPHHAQVADIWRPELPGELPVVVLIHGGFWRQLYTKRLMHGLAKAVVAQGWVAYNVEYRRVGALGSGGWPATFEDVSTAINALAIAEGIDTTKVITCGHSAGGQLALWAVSDRRTRDMPDHQPHPVRPCGGISLAGVVDLVAAARQAVGSGAIEALMGGSPDEYPDRYSLGSPAERLPLGVPHTLIHGLRDATVPASLSENYVARAVARGDDAIYVPLPVASHMDMIGAQGDAFSAIVTFLDRFTSPIR